LRRQGRRSIVAIPTVVLAALPIDSAGSATRMPPGRPGRREVEAVSLAAWPCGLGTVVVVGIIGNPLLVEVAVRCGVGLRARDQDLK
jgi:hypothetical protein